MYKYFASVNGMMRKISLLPLAVLATTFLVASCGPRVCRHDKYMTISGYAQGGVYSVQLNLKGVAVSPEEIRDSVDIILQNVDRSLSGYNRNSLLSRFNNGEEIIPDDLFMDMYAMSYDMFHDTDGVIDVASAPLFDIWGFGFNEGTSPSSDEVAATLSVSGTGRMHSSMEKVLTPQGTLRPSDMLLEEGALPKLNYNAVAQGYSCDVVAEYLYRIGVKDMLVNIGEIFCDGKNPSGGPWTIGIDRPVDGNNELGAELQGVFSAPDGPHGIVTSGNYRKFYIKDGKKYAHTIDPRTGYPVTHNLLSATVVAPSAFEADAYATYCMVVGLEESMKVISAHPAMECCLVYDDGGEYRVWCSEGFVLSE